MLYHSSKRNLINNLKRSFAMRKVPGRVPEGIKEVNFDSLEKK
jgi:hypothetical protein